jgi:hypothetical protein
MVELAINSWLRLHCRVPTHTERSWNNPERLSLAGLLY